MDTSDSSSADGEPDDDPVIGSFDVFLSHELLDQLYVVQHPLRPVRRPMDTPARARIRPHNQILEMTYALDPNSAHYDDSAGAGRRITELTHRSRTVRPETRNYAVGVLHADAATGARELHLTPVAGVLQMRPSFAHVDLLVTRF